MSFNGFEDLFNKEKNIDERYEVNFLKNSVYNLIFGKLMTFNHYGDMVCKNLNNGDTCETKVHPCTGIFLKERDKAWIIGHCMPAGGGI